MCEYCGQGAAHDKKSVTPQNSPTQTVTIITKYIQRRHKAEQLILFFKNISFE